MILNYNSSDYVHSGKCTVYQNRSVCFYSHSSFGFKPCRGLIPSRTRLNSIHCLRIPTFPSPRQPSVKRPFRGAFRLSGAAWWAAMAAFLHVNVAAALMEKAWPQAVGVVTAGERPSFVFYGIHSLKNLSVFPRFHNYRSYSAVLEILVILTCLQTRKEWQLSAEKVL